MNKNKKVDNKVKQAAGREGERLAFLLYASQMPDEAKQAWINMIPEMNPEQIQRLMGILEKEQEYYANADEEELMKDPELDSELTEINKRRDKKLENLEKKTMKKLEDIDKKLSEEK